MKQQAGDQRIMWSTLKKLSKARNYQDPLSKPKQAEAFWLNHQTLRYIEKYTRQQQVHDWELDKQY
jgi:hypothetical protein